MNPSKPIPAESELPDALRWQLRALQQPQVPARDLWPEISRRLVTTPQRPAQTPTWRRWQLPTALAATVLVAWGVFALMRPELGQRPLPLPLTMSPVAASAPTLVQIEAAGLTRQYQAAVAEIATVPPSPVLQPAVEELDRSAALILDALERDPGSQLLLDQLRRTYTSRLALAHRMT